MYRCMCGLSIVWHTSHYVCIPAKVEVHPPKSCRLEVIKSLNYRDGVVQLNWIVGHDIIDDQHTVNIKSVPFFKHCTSDSEA